MGAQKIRAENMNALILIIEDSEDDVRLLKRTVAQAGVTYPVFAVKSGSEAINYLTGGGENADNVRFPLPRIIFLDLKMPPPDSMEILRWKQTQPHLQNILWVVLSSLDSSKAIKDAYEAGATTFLTKPVQTNDLTNLIQTFRQFWIA